ncbi:MAG TPA: hypothetical protein PLI95_09080 [Polyangiaceae bacterium]|nr:hypothetical protein [Polyangiaceae bacterium]
MNTTNQIKRFALLALARMSGEPMPADVLRDTLRVAFHGLTAGDLDRAVRELEADGYIAGSHVDLIGVLWVLTAKGHAKVVTL